MSSSRPLLAPYRSIGLFIDENKPFLFHAGQKMFLLASTSHSYKIYRLPEMKVKLLGPNLPNKIRAITAHDENTFVACSNKIYHFQHYHLVRIIEKVQGKITCLMHIGTLLIVTSQLGEVVVFDYKHPEDNASSFKVDFAPLAIIHPPTYLNKILLVGEKNLELRNLRTTNLIYDFMNESSDLFKYIKEKTNHKASYITDNLTGYRKGPVKTSSLSILCSEVSPALDIVAFGFSNGEIVLHNIKQNKVLQIYHIKDSKPTGITFSQTDLPLLAVGTDKGDIVVFSLNDENILSTIHGAHKSSINYVEFMKNELTLLSGSYGDNSLLMWQYDELENSKFRLLRKRNGLTAPIKKLRFYGDEGHHVIASSFSENAEIKDYFLWNEGFQGEFSTKRNKSLKKLNFNTENIQEVSQIVDFSFSSNRATDWSNLLTSHKNFDKPHLWSTEDHTLVKKNIKWEKPLPANAQITKVFVTECGNFGIIGYADGNIMKVNMQSGALQKEFHQKITKTFAATSINPKEAHKAPISGLFVDPYNTVLVSADTEYLLVNWDFYSGTINKIIFTYPSKITMTKPSKTSSLFCVAYEDFKIEVYDQYTLNKARVFNGHKNRVMDVCFTRNNRQVVSCSLDCTIKVWDIISNQIINNLQLKTPVISMDFDPSGDFLVTAFSNSKEVFIWNNRIGKELMGTEEEIPIKFVSDVSKEEGARLRKRYIDKAKRAGDTAVPEYSDQDVEALGDFFKEQNKIHEIEEKSGLVGFFEQDIGKWMPLVNFDEIREKNKPKQTVENNVVAPFFLEFDNRFSQLASKMDGNIDEEKKDAEKPKTKVVRKENRNKFLEEVASNLERLVVKTKQEEEEIGGDTYEKMLEEMKKLNPAQLDYEIRMLTFGKIQNIEVLLDFFSYLFKQPSDYDLKQIYLNNFLKICSDELLTNPTLSSRVQEIKENLDLHWKSLNDQINSNLCMVQHFAKIKS